MHNHATLQVTIHHPWIQQTFSGGMHVEEVNVHYYMGIDFSEKRLIQQKAGRHRKGDRILNNELESEVLDNFSPSYVIISTMPKGKRNYTTPHVCISLNNPRRNIPSEHDQNAKYRLKQSASLISYRDTWPSLFECGA